MEATSWPNEKDNVESIFAVTGFSFAGRGENMAIGFVKLKDWSLRKRVEQNVQAIAGRAMGSWDMQYPRCIGVRLRTACRAGAGQCQRL